MLTTVLVVIAWACTELGAPWSACRKHGEIRLFPKEMSFGSVAIRVATHDLSFDPSGWVLLERILDEDGAVIEDIEAVDHGQVILVAASENQAEDATQQATSNARGAPRAPPRPLV